MIRVKTPVAQPTSPKINAVMGAAFAGYRWLDQWVGDQLMQAAKTDLGSSVCFGCSLGHCCTQPVGATYIDVFPIALALHAAGWNTTAYRAKLKAAGKEQEKAFIDGTEDHDERFRCPLLSDARRCMVYRLRPAMCRVYLVFETRDNCIPYQTRPDGSRPLVCCVDHGEAVSAALSVAVDFAEKNGAPLPRRPWFRAFPTQLAIVMEALWKPDKERWGHIWKHCAIDDARFAAFAEVQRKRALKRVVRGPKGEP